MRWLFRNYPWHTALALLAVVAFVLYDLAHGDLWAAVTAVVLAGSWKTYRARLAYAARQSERVRVEAEQVSIRTRNDAIRLGLPWPDDDRPYVVDLAKLNPEASQ